MQKEEFINIADKVSEGLATDQEKQLFLFHLGTFATQNPEWEKLAPEFRQQIEDGIKSDIRVQVFGEHKHKSKTIKLWPRMIGVAAAIALVVLSVYFFNYRNDTHTDSNVLTTQDITPGKVGATLTLANGKKIKLSDAVNGEIAKEAGISVTKTADGQLVYEIKETTGDPNKINTLSTAQGQTYRVRLPDGSSVWLNAASSLTYSTSLNKGISREVMLNGEAYFEVFKDKRRPFIVRTRKQRVEVLGTHFNLSSYKDEPFTKTTLLEGAVKVSSLHKVEGKLPVNQGSLILKPGQQAIMTNDNRLNVVSADIDEAMAWINGYFLFDDEAIESVMKKIARWYDVEVEFEGKLEGIAINGMISRNKNLSEVLSVLEKTREVHFKIEGRRVRVMQ